MRKLIGWGVLGGLLIGLLGLPWLLLDAAPAVEPPPAFRRADLAWAKSLLQKHDPRRQTPNVVHSIRLDETELNRLLNYAVELKRVSGIAANLTPGQATLSATLAVPATPLGRYLNLTAEIAEVPGGIRIESLQLGSLPVPGLLANSLARWTHQRLRRDATYAALADAFKQVHFEENQAALDYHWHPALLTQLERKSAELLIPPEDQARILAYAERLDALVKQHPRGSTLPLPSLLAPLMLMESPHNDAAMENRAAITALGAYIAGVSLPRLLKGNSQSIRRAPPVLLSLHGRQDFAEHFAIAAALTVNGNGRLANALGLIKEEEDARKGSGFSFTDLAADRSGVQFGERAMGDAADRVRQHLLASRQDIDLMPVFSDLPEFMPQAEFERRFGPVGSARYQALIKRIDARLAAHPLTR